MPDGRHFILFVHAAGPNSPKPEDQPAALQKAERTAYEVRQELKTIKVSGLQLLALCVADTEPLQKLPQCTL